MLMEHLSRQRLPCLNFLPGLKGVGNSFSFLLHPNQQWHASKYMSSSLALALLLYYVACSQREDSSTQKLINQSVQLFTKKSNKAKLKILGFSLSFLARQLLDCNAEVMSAAVNLVAATIKNREVDPKFLYYSLELLKANG